jgi:hypothetical protein
MGPHSHVAEANDCVAHMLQVLNAARKAKLRILVNIPNYASAIVTTKEIVASISSVCNKE